MEIRKSSQILLSLFLSKQTKINLVSWLSLHVACTDLVRWSQGMHKLCIAPDGLQLIIAYMNNYKYMQVSFNN